MALIIAKPHLNLNQTARRHLQYTTPLHHRPLPAPSSWQPPSRPLLQNKLSSLDLTAKKRPAGTCRCSASVNETATVPSDNETVTLPSGLETRRILWSDVEVKPQPPRATPWNAMDIAVAGFIAGMHVLTLFAPWNFTWPAFWTAAVLYWATGSLGISLSYHRHLSHKSLKLPKWLEYVFAYCGTHAVQGTPTDWVSTHLYHHGNCDAEADPHSPTNGFWFSHTGWLFDQAGLVQRVGGGAENAADMDRQPFYKFIRQTYILHPIALGALLYAVGGFPMVVWGMGVRTVLTYHVTWLINSACHVWGYRSWNTGDLSRNNWWVALLTFGEGWHNNHHAFGHSARIGLKWWEVDVTWNFIKLLEKVGLATDVRLPSPVAMQRFSETEAEAAN